MRRQKEGTIINISSVNGFVATPCASAYAATKFALEAFTQSLRFELYNFGIRVTSIEPGAFSTNIIKGGFHLAKRIADGEISAFRDLTNQVAEKTREIISNGADPRIAADLVAKIANTKDPDIRYPIGEDAKKIFEIKNQMSDKEFENFMLQLLNLG